MRTRSADAVVVEHVRAGNYFQTAARGAGIHTSTLYAWLARGEDGDPIFAEWYDAMQEADALAEIDPVAKVREGARDGRLT